MRGAWAALGAVLCGCAPTAVQPTNPPTPAPVVRAAPTPASLGVVVDGRVEEWPEGLVATADESFVYIRFRVEGEAKALQASDETLVLLLDLDGSTVTGATGQQPASIADLGIDLEVQFSPLSAGGRPRSGIAVFAVDRTGTRRPISHAQADVVLAPTHASEWYELRVARNVEGVDLLWPTASGPVLREAGGRADAEGAPRPRPRVRPATTAGGGVFLLYDQRGELAGASEPFGFVLPPVSDPPALPMLEIPPARGDAVRVVSWNVLRSSPQRTPGPFARMLRALEPDVLLIQEWDGATAGQIERWMEVNLGGEWWAVTGPGGVAIASPHEILDADGRELRSEGQGRAIRYVGALVRTPLMDTHVASVHLKCCGGASGSEEALRRAEALAINEAFLDNAPAWRTLRIIGGDFNLVGTRRPLDLLRAELDLDGTALEPATTRVWGDRTVYTWSDPGSNFAPGWLDWVVYSDSAAEAVRAFAVDLARLAPEALEAAGLEPEDNLASDHLPVVVDLRPLTGQRLGGERVVAPGEAEAPAGTAPASQVGDTGG